MPESVNTFNSSQANLSSQPNSPFSCPSFSSVHGGRGRRPTATSVDLSFGDSRNVMRLAYKQLKGDGPHLFDFSKPFSSATNQAVAARVVEQARRLPQCQNWDEIMWTSEILLLHVFK